MTHVLIDTNIILDFFLERKPFFHDALKIFTLAERKKIKVFVTSLSYSNSYYILRQVGSHDTVIESLKKLAKITEILCVDSNTVDLALSSDFKDFEDALQYLAALQKSKINIIITRNTKDYKNSKLPVMTPEDYFNS
ncbi:MAG: PIN domain-containing protein [Bacteroidota bacterium]